MPLANYPEKTKYAYLDYVFILAGGYIDCVQIAGWRVIVDDPSGDDSGRQRTYYKFLDKGNLELIESKVYSSRNHLLWDLKRDGYLFSYLNVACESQTGGYSIFKALAESPDPLTLQPSFSDWVDLAGLDLQYAMFQGDAYPRAGTGTVAILNGSDQVVGDGTLFTEEFAPSYPILINHYDGNPLGCIRFVLSIEDDEHLTLSSNVNQDYNDVRLFYFDKSLAHSSEGIVSASSGTKALTGVGTSFTDFQINDVIRLVYDSGSEINRVIETITDDTHLTVKTNINSAITGQRWYNWNKVRADVEFIVHYHGNATSPEEIEGEKSLVFDGTNLFGATMPSYMDTKEKFRDVVRSYDAKTTKWIDNTLMGIP